MLEDGPLRHLIADTAKDTLKQIKLFTSSCRSHRIVPVANGLFAASGNQGTDSVSGYQNVWVGDNVMVANSFRLRGELDPAISCVQGLTRFLRTQLPRFREAIADLLSGKAQTAGRTSDLPPRPWPSCPKNGRTLKMIHSATRCGFASCSRIPALCC